jgi:hypothetical protein
MKSVKMKALPSREVLMKICVQVPQGKLFCGSSQVQPLSVGSLSNFGQHLVDRRFRYTEACHVTPAGEPTLTQEASARGDSAASVIFRMVDHAAARSREGTRHSFTRILRVNYRGDLTNEIGLVG